MTKFTVNSLDASWGLSYTKQVTCIKSQSNRYAKYLKIITQAILKRLITCQIIALEQMDLKNWHDKHIMNNVWTKKEISIKQ